MLQEERHTQHSVAFKVALSDKIVLQETPEIKKKLESYAKSAQGPLTLESIEEKLKKAEAKRRSTQVTSPKVEERRKVALERKRNRDIESEKHFREKVERDLSDADEKRRISRDERMKKLRDHINKVETIREEQQVKRRESTENLQKQLEKKLDLASQKREEQLEQVKTIAHHASEKKKSAQTTEAAFGKTADHTQ